MPNFKYWEILANSRGGYLWIWDTRKLDFVEYDKTDGEYTVFYNKESVNIAFKKAKENAELLKNVRIAEYSYSEE